MKTDNKHSEHHIEWFAMTEIGHKSSGSNEQAFEVGGGDYGVRGKGEGIRERYGKFAVSRCGAGHELQNKAVTQ
jgi:hypothetical protein